MANFLLPLVGVVAEQQKASFIRKTHDCEGIQTQFLLKLLRCYQNTEFGREYGFSEIQSVDQFRDRIPIRPYSGYEPYTHRIFQGEQNILTPDPVVFLSLSSGSTSAQKYIPVTKRFQNSLSRANLTCIGFLNAALKARQRKFGKVLITNSTQLAGRSPGGIDYGPASVGVMRMGKLLAQQLFANPLETLLPADSVARHYVCLLFALRDREMRGIAANFPMLVLRICNYLEKYAEDFIADLENGTIANWLPLEPEVRILLERQWLANPHRARELREILRAEGRLTPILAWPGFAFIGTARGGISDFYFQRFPEYFADTPVFGTVYSASEATFSIYPDVDMDGSVLAIESGFFEFIPSDQWELEQPKTLLPTEVKVGESYRILVSNYSGFYRYDIGDVVEVVGFYQTVPLIVFRHRKGGFICSTTEKTTEHHVAQVMQRLQQEFDSPVEDFCVTLSEDIIPARYLINIELAPGKKLPDPQVFLARCDRQLQEANISYAMKRPTNYIPAPRLRILAPGSFAIVRQRQLQRGIPDSQLKFPHISEDRQFLAGLAIEQEVRLPEDID